MDINSTLQQWLDNQSAWVRIMFDRALHEPLNENDVAEALDMVLDDCEYAEASERRLRAVRPHVLG